MAYAASPADSLACAGCHKLRLALASAVLPLGLPLVMIFRLAALLGFIILAIMLDSFPPPRGIHAVQETSARVLRSRMHMTRSTPGLSSTR